jgi:hypothetical protein
LRGQTLGETDNKQREETTLPSKTTRILRILRTLLRAYLKNVLYFPGPEFAEEVLSLLKTSRTMLDEKVAKAHESLLETVSLIEELEGTLKESTEKLGALRQEYEKYSKLSGIEEDKARVLLEQVERTIGKNKGREQIERLLISLAAGLIVFVLGIVLGPIITPIIRSWVKIG